MVNITTKLPQNILAEQCTIGASLNNTAAIDQIEYLLKEHFDLPLHKNLWSVIKSLEKPDKLMLLETMKSKQLKINYDGMQEIEYLEYCQTLAIDGLSAVKYAKQVYKSFLARNIISKSLEQIKMAMAINPTTDIVDICDNVNTTAFEIEELSIPLREKKGARYLSEIVEQDIIPTLDAIRQDKMQLLKTGLTLVDNKLFGGIQSHRVVLIGARSGVGKTECALSIINAALNQDITVLAFSLEMEGSEVAQRSIQMHENLSVAPFLDPKRMMEAEYKAFIDTLHNNKPKLLIDDTSDISPLYIRRTLKKYLNNGINIGLVVVDYAGIQSVPHKIEREGTNSKMRYIHAQNKQTCKDCKVPFLVLEQFTNQIEKRAKKEPIGSDFQYNAINDCDIALALMDPSSYDRHSIRAGEIDIYFLKNRQNPSFGKVTVYKNKLSGLYEDLQGVSSLDRLKG